MMVPKNDVIKLKNGGKTNVMSNRWGCMIQMTLYAGIIAFHCVPSISCYSDRSSLLTFDKIFNDTNYPQIKYKPRTYYQIVQEQTAHKNAKNSHSNETKVLDEDNYKLNDIEYSFDSEVHDDTKNSHALLVGFSHDPYRISVPEYEYIKGVRNPKPQYKVERGKRGVVHLYNMIQCATGCDPISYKGYGCYCGFLGNGKPMDGIDKCCKMHDKCYEDIYCPFFTVYFQPFYWKCHHGQPLCALENHETRNQYINGCAAKLCECDRKFAMCLQKYRCPRGRALCTSSPLRLLQNLLMFP